MEEKSKARFETALVTGASSGIGLEVARRLAKEGYNLLLVARDKKQLTDVAIQIRGDYKVSVGVIAQDLAKENAAQDLYNLIKKNNQKISVLVNNAGFGGYGEHIERKLVDEQAMIHLNIQTLMSLTKLFAADMAANGDGKILNVASVAGYLPGPYQAVYFATKAFVVSYSLAVAQELQNKGVSVTCLCPGPTATQFAARAGMANSSVFKNGMEADTVARLALDGLFHGKTLVVPGFRNKLSLFGLRFLSQTFVAKVFAKRSAALFTK